MVEIEASCPFCGSNGVNLCVRNKAIGYTGDGIRVEMHRWYVRCRKCYARGPVCSDRRLGVYEDSAPAWKKYDLDLKAEAIEKWNERADVSKAKV